MMPERNDGDVVRGANGWLVKSGDAVVAAFPGLTTESEDAARRFVEDMRRGGPLGAAVETAGGEPELGPVLESPS
jgi:hypothetical protein